MNSGAVFARLLNSDGELIAEGPCYLDEAAGHATLEPERSPGVLQKERGPLALELDTGRSYRVSDRPMIIHYRAPGAGESGRHRVFRLRLLPYIGDTIAQDANAAGAAEEGTSAVLPGERRPPLNGETPAAR